VVREKKDTSSVGVGPSYCLSPSNVNFALDFISQSERKCWYDVALGKVPSVDAFITYISRP
jgi:hypothetical protein